MAAEETEYEGRSAAPRVLVVAAHPDDETIGCGGLLLGLSGRAPAYVVHVTDGAPRDRRFVPEEAAPTREGYAEERRKETVRALALAGIGKERLYSLGAVDQEASFELVRLVRALVELFVEIRPDIVVAHPYEGGHPDHDAASFATHRAFELAKPQLDRPILIEMSSYHGPSGELVTGRFLQGDSARFGSDAHSSIEVLSKLRDPELGDAPVRFRLPLALRARKASMMSCFETQRAIFAPFGTDCEWLRKAPRYDFSRPPHEGRLYYEHLGWPMTGAAFREHVQRACRELSPW